MKLNYISFLICLVFISQSCLWLSGDKDLGNGYFLFVDRMYTCIIRSSTDSYKGTGLVVIPETVIKLNYNKDVIVALSKDIDTEEKRF